MRTTALALVLGLGAAPVMAQSITRLSAPALGRACSVRYASAPSSIYTMFFSGVPLGATTIPGIGGVLYLPLASLVSGYNGVVPANGSDTVAIPVPANQGLLGGSLAIQALDLALPATLNFSTNAVDFSISGGVGSLALAEATNTATTTGDLQLSVVQNPSVGEPVLSAVVKGVPLTITSYGKLGFLQAVATQSTSGVEMAELDIDDGSLVARSCHDNATQHMQLPNGYDLYVMRDLAKPKEFFLLSVQRATGQAFELSGSRAVDTSATAQPASNYQAQFAFTDDGEIAIAVQGDTNNNPVGNVGVPDRIVLVHTDPNKTWSNGKNVLDVSPPPGPNALFTQYNGTLRICNGMGFLEGEEPSGATGEAALWGGPIDGSAKWARISVPDTGTGMRFYWSYSLFRSTPDGKTTVFLNGGNGANINTDMDVMAIRNISPTSPPVVVNVTKFPTATQIATWGTASLGTTGNSANGVPTVRAALSPDGARVAFLIGAGTIASPHQLAIARTDGSDAGNVTPFTAGLFDPQIVQFSELWWFNNGRLIFAAGGAPTTGSVPQAGFDLYAYDLGTATVTPITKTTTGSLVVPFTQGGTSGNLVIRASWLSRNGLFYYFVRHVPDVAAVQVKSDIVGINLASLAVFDVTGSEFSAGTAPSLRAINAVSPYSWFLRRAPDGKMYFACGKNTGALTSFADDEVWRFDPESGGAAVQLTQHNGTGASAAAVRQISEFRLSPDGSRIAYSLGVGTAVTNTEDLYVVATAGGPAVKLTRQPATGVIGIRRGSVFFTPTPFPGVVWSQGTNSRATPSLGAAAYWNAVIGGTIPLLLGTPPSPSTTKHVLVLSAGLANP